MTDQRIAVAEALAARLCHDVAGLAGTLAAALQADASAAALLADASAAALLADASAVPSEEALDVARDAAVGLVRRVRLSRAAWAGSADWAEGALPVLFESLATDRFRVDLDAATTAQGRTPEIGRLLLNVAMLGMETLRGRGGIVFAAGPGEVRATLAPAREWPGLVDRDLGDPSLFQAAFTALLARSVGATLRVTGATLAILPRA